MAVEIPLSLKVEDWPHSDQVLWQTAQKPPGFLCPPRPASKWSPKRRRIAEQAYGQWLSWLRRNECLHVDTSPGDRATEERIDEFLKQLGERVAPQSVSMMAGAIKRMLDVLAPESDWIWLGKRCAYLKRNAEPSRNKLAHEVPPDELYGLGIRLMETSRNLAGHPYHEAIQYRDGLMISVLIASLVRMANLRQIEIGTHLHFAGNLYWLCFTEEETKTGSSIEAELPVGLAHYIDTYLQTHRPALLALGQGAPTHRLWIDRSGKPMGEAAIRQQIKTRTKAEFGRHVWPHLFRTCGVTGLVDRAPEKIGLAPELLGHSSLQTTQKHYILAKGTLAHQAVQSNLHDVRAKALKRISALR